MLADTVAIRTLYTSQTMKRTPIAGHHDSCLGPPTLIE